MYIYIYVYIGSVSWFTDQHNQLITGTEVVGLAPHAHPKCAALFLWAEAWLGGDLGISRARGRSKVDPRGADRRC